MDENARKIFAEAYETLDRIRDVTVEHRDHSGEYWSRPEPKSAPVPRPRQPTVAEVEAMRAADWTAFVDSRIERALAERKWPDEAVAAILLRNTEEFRA